MPQDTAPNVTLGGFCKDWLSARKPDLSPASQELYVNTMKQLEDFFGKDANLRDITPKKAAVFVAEQRNLTKGCEGKNLSDWSREQIKRNCKAIFETAVQWDFLRTNLFKSIRSKKLWTRRWHRVSVQEYHALLEAAQTLRWKSFYALAYTSGARLHELFSLTWNDIDFQNGSLIIANRQGTVDMPPFHVKDHEARRIPLPAHTIDLLTQLQTHDQRGFLISSWIKNATSR